MMILIASLILFLVSAGNAYAAQEYYSIAQGRSQEINEFGICLVVTNYNCGATIFVPTRTSTEWSRFRTHAPNCVLPFSNCADDGNGNGEDDCECTSGPCCDGCHYLPQGTSCGINRECDRWGNCVDVGNGNGNDCECSSGPCCDGCHYTPGVSCGTTETWTDYVWDGTSSCTGTSTCYRCDYQKTYTCNSRGVCESQTTCTNAREMVVCGTCLLSGTCTSSVQRCSPCRDGTSCGGSCDYCMDNGRCSRFYWYYYWWQQIRLCDYGPFVGQCSPSTLYRTGAFIEETAADCTRQPFESLKACAFYQWATIYWHECQYYYI